MDWTEQSSNMMKAWADSQQQMMSAWMETMQNMTRSTSQTMPDMWREMVLQGIRSMTMNTDPTAQNVAQKMFASQMNMMKFIEMAMQTWNTMYPIAQNGGDWQAALKQQSEMMRNQLLNGATQNVQNMSSMQQLWNAYTKEAMSMGQPWMQAMQNSTQYFDDVMSGNQNNIVEMTSLYWDAFQDSFGSFLQMPGLGYSREMDEKVRQSFAAWIDLQRASFDYQVIIVDIWMNAFERLMTEMAEVAQDGETVDGIRDFLNRWTAIADDSFKQAFHSEQYVELQGKLINSMMEYRQQQRRVNEVFMEMYDIPTRTEVDEAHRRIYELRKELKAVKRELADLKKDDKPKKKKTTRKRTSKKKKADK